MAEKNLEELMEEYLNRFKGENIPIDRGFNDEELRNEIEIALKTGKPIKYGSDFGKDY